MTASAGGEVGDFGRVCDNGSIKDEMSTLAVRIRGPKAGTNPVSGILN